MVRKNPRFKKPPMLLIRWKRALGIAETNCALSAETTNSVTWALALGADGWKGEADEWN